MFLNGDTFLGFSRYSTVCYINGDPDLYVDWYSGVNRITFEVQNTVAIVRSEMTGNKRLI